MKSPTKLKKKTALIPDSQVPQVHVHVVVVFGILKISVKNTDFRSEKYHLVDFLVNLLVHQPIHEHHHLDFLVNLHVQDLIHDHLQAKICHFETFKQMKN